jgi:hypothetical protein
MDKSDTVVSVIVGGISFTTTLEVLTVSGYFRGLIACAGVDIKPNSLLCVVNNRSAHCFKKVLAYLTDKKYPYPRKLAYELDFYDVDYELSTLYEKNDLTQRIDILEQKIKELETPKRGPRGPKGDTGMPGSQGPRGFPGIHGPPS